MPDGVVERVSESDGAEGEAERLTVVRDILGLCVALPEPEAEALRDAEGVAVKVRVGLRVGLAVGLRLQGDRVREKEVQEVVGVVEALRELRV